MADFFILKMTKLSPIHIGTGKENYDFSADDLHSDTISSALASIRAQQGNIDDLESFLNSFRVSSAFPFWKQFYFLPKIQGHLDIIVDGKEEQDYRKKLKQIKFIELALWQELANGRTIHIKESQIQKEFLIPDTCTDWFPPYCSQVSQRVTVPRTDGQDTEPFYFDWSFFNDDAGLFCLLEASEASIDEIEQLFHTLGTVGIGTDRSVGGGQFYPVIDKISLNTPDAPNAVTTLSLFIPEEEELNKFDLETSRYRLVFRSGYLSGSSIDRFKHLRKKSIYMFDVGSVFLNADKLTGKIVNLRPEWNDPAMHDVYRSGMPLYLHIKI